MTAYFDDVQSQIGKLQADGYYFENINKIEEKMVFDCTVAVMLPGVPGDIREAVHRAVLRYAVCMMPVNAPEPDFETFDEHKRRISNLCSDLHTAFHDLARSGTPRYGDDPRTPLRCLYADGEIEREEMVDKAKEGRLP